MAHIIQDPESTSLQQQFAIIHTPRKSRKRYAESCVTVYADQQAAVEQSDTKKNRHPAIVYGPSVSSESQRIYYLVRWL